jgi:energy-coupling factor transporter ATP-binding protein EcfA2
MAAPLLVVTGPPGAGKSTVAAVLAGRFPESALVEVDAFFGFLRGRCDRALAAGRSCAERDGDPGRRVGGRPLRARRPRHRG